MMRSLLYVPADNPRFIAGAAGRGADAVILDLEDSVLPHNKAAAREGLADAVARAGARGAKVLVRINAHGREQAADAEAACRAGAVALMVPKVGDPAELSELDGLLSRVEASVPRPRVGLVAMIEGPGAVLDARSIARTPRVVGLLAGSEDLALALGARPEPEVLRLPKLLVHYAARAEGKLSFGLLRSVADYRDLGAVAAAAAEARAHGFDGATCVHPSVVPVLNSAFAPSDQELAWARRVLARAGEAGAYVVDGRMVDAPVIARARRLLADDG